MRRQPATAPAASDTPARADVRERVREPVRESENKRAPAAAQPPAMPATRPAPADAAAAQPAEDSVRTLQQLPEAIQREIPKVAFGGYIYSPDPAERLLLVDKMLRREGEEVAPGLVLERLLPKAAIMNYRGYRYRVAY